MHKKVKMAPFSKNVYLKNIEMRIMHSYIWMCINVWSVSLVRKVILFGEWNFLKVGDQFFNNKFQIKKDYLLIAI